MVSLKDAQKQHVTMELIAHLCKQYDEQTGEYPESRFEGKSVFWHICEKVLGISPYDSSGLVYDLYQGTSED